MIVRKLRLEKGLSQEQLAHLAGISTRTLQRIERGATASPETLKCIASVLETAFDNLRKEQEMSPEEQPELPRLSAEEKEAMERCRGCNEPLRQVAHRHTVMKTGPPGASLISRNRSGAATNG